MNLKHLLAAAAATALMAGAAHAQTMTQPADSSMPAPMTTPAGDPAGTVSTTTTDTSADGTTATSTTTTMPMASTGATSDISASVTTTTVTNGPVADTPENRAKYRPLSHAGNRSAAKGN